MDSLSKKEQAIQSVLKQVITYVPDGWLVSIEKFNLIQEFLERLLSLATENKFVDAKLLSPFKNDPLPSTASLIVTFRELVLDSEQSLQTFSELLKGYETEYSIDVGKGGLIRFEFGFVGTYVKLVPAE